MEARAQDRNRRPDVEDKQGATVGGLTGPAGAAIGAVAGALGGKAIAEWINPQAAANYWKTNRGSQSYLKSGSTYDDYAPAYMSVIRITTAARSMKSSPNSGVTGIPAVEAPAWRGKMRSTRHLTRLSARGTRSSAQSRAIRTATGGKAPHG